MRIIGETAPGRRAQSKKRRCSRRGERDTTTSDRDQGVLIAARRRVDVRILARPTSRQLAFRTRPPGTTPVLVMAHSATRILRARATIMILRSLPPPLAAVVRARYHFARSLSGWNIRKRQASWTAILN